MKRFIYSAIFALVAQFSQAQPYGGFHLLGSAPLGQFNAGNYREALGVDFEFFSNNLLRHAVNPNKLDFRIGGGMEIQAAGREKFDVTLNTPNSDAGVLSLNNDHFGFLAIGRFTFRGEQKFTPYADIFGGARIISSYEMLRPKKNVSGYENETRKTLFDRGALHYGLSLGAIYQFNSIVGLDMRLTYSKGSNAPFVDLSSAYQEGNTARYTIRNTQTDLFLFRVGVIFRIHEWHSSSDEYDSSPNPVRPYSNSPAPRPLEVKPVPNH